MVTYTTQGGQFKVSRTVLVAYEIIGGCKKEENPVPLRGEKFRVGVEGQACSSDYLYISVICSLHQEKDTVKVVLNITGRRKSNCRFK